jgi:hypothetical protein
MKAPLHTTRIPLLLALAGAGFVFRPATLHALFDANSSACVDVKVDVRSPHGPPAPALERAPPAPVTSPPHVFIVEVETPAPPPAPAPPAPPAAEPPPLLESLSRDGTPAPREAEPRLGLQSFFARAGGQDVSMRGFGSTLRVRPLPHFAFDFGVASFSGQDDNGMDRWEVPFTTDLLVFVNPRRRLQLYFVAGVGVSFSTVEGDNVHRDTYDRREFWHLGAQTGIGLEWRIGRHFALNADFRAFIRQRMANGDPRPEFAERHADGMRSTDTSAGSLGRLGATFYFGRS